MKRPQLTLRDLFWLVLVAAVAAGWSVVHVRAAKRLSELKKTFPMFTAERSFNRSEDAMARTVAIEKLSKLSDSQLSERFGEMQDGNINRGEPEYEPCLTELARRGLHGVLQEHYERLMVDVDKDPNFPDNLELLIALRRAQGRPDPLKIHVELVQPDDSGSLGSGPQIRATLENVDVGQESACLTRGGDLRDGRRECWRVHLTDEEGRRAPNLKFTLPGYLNEIGWWGPLAFGEKEKMNWLDARRYVRPPASSTYRLQVIHSRHSIAEEPNLAGMIVLESEPVTVRVERHDWQEHAKSMLPPIAILSIAGTFGVALAFRRLVQSRNTSGCVGPVIRRRDVIWLALVVALAAGWLFDSRYLTFEFVRLTPDQEANWTMRLAE